VIRMLAELRPGARFRHYGVTGRLIRLTPSAAEVELVCQRDRSFRTRDVREVRIRRSKERTTWSRATAVDVSR
jgi:hypothetical protein